MIKRTIGLSIMAAAAVLAGCAKQSAAPPVSDDGAAASSVATASAVAQPVVEIKSWVETQELIARHKGSIVVVDFWGTW